LLSFNSRYFKCHLICNVLKRRSEFLNKNQRNFLRHPIRMGFKKFAINCYLILNSNFFFLLFN
jgi:hypothetical protein